MPSILGTSTLPINTGDLMHYDRQRFIKDFKSLFGTIPLKDSEFRKRHRIHQGWWRTVVLLEEAGPNPSSPGDWVCNTFNIEDGDPFKKKRLNYLDEATPEVVQDAIDRLKDRENKAGLIGEPRIWNNLLSSQPLAFNFWAPLKLKSALANQFLPHLIPGFSELIDIEFEWAPEQKYTGDRSAYDVLIKYQDTDAEEVWLGLEVKFTDTFSDKKYDREEYRELYDRYHKDVFAAEYDEFIKPEYNQLFRNQLIACSLHQHEQRKVRCGLFITEVDQPAIETAKSYQGMLSGCEEPFILLTYEAFIGALQQAPLSWEDREWSMLLWARYLGWPLSEMAYYGLGRPSLEESPDPRENK